MKKSLYLLLLSVFFLSSCSDDDNGFKVPELVGSNTIDLTAGGGSEGIVSLALKGEKIYIDWGDGKVTKAKSPDELSVYQHKYDKEYSWQIRIWSEEITSFIIDGKVYTMDVDYLGFGHCPKLETLHVSSVDYLDGLGDRDFPELTAICAYNIRKTPFIDFRGAPNLEVLYCYDNPALMTLYVNGNPKLKKLVVYNNRFGVWDMNRMFLGLPQGTPDCEVFCYGNPGSATCNTSIAEDKGWSVTNFE